MSKIIYDVIQRFEVEDGVPRLLSTNIQVIQGGEDLLSLATTILKRLGFYDQFDENRTSQYIGYKLKNPPMGAKRYQVILSQRKEGLCISIPKNILQPDILELTCITIENVITTEGDFDEYYKTNVLGKYWILPSKEDLFLESMESYYPNILRGEVRGSFALNSYYTYTDIADNEATEMFSMSIEQFKIDHLGDSCNYLIINEDKLFPYTWQVCIDSREKIEEFLNYFIKIIMEQKL